MTGPDCCTEPPAKPDGPPFEAGHKRVATMLGVWHAAVIWVAGAVFHLAGAAASAEPASPCMAHAFEGADYTVCEIDLRTHELRLFWRDESGVPYGLPSRLPREADGMPLVVAMNAGMYDAGLAPIGLYIAAGEMLKRANTAEGPGNFHLKPNGVFFVAGHGAGVLTTERFLETQPAAQLATQSGPMLVIDGEIHPRFLPHSTSRKRRNGIGVRDPQTVVFAISDGIVTFWEFARLFRDGLGIDDALFLDGTMSSLHVPATGRTDMIRPMGPMIAAFLAAPQDE
jgi:uncharacterized protein YigE (DUF2233 family)